MVIKMFKRSVCLGILFLFALVIFIGAAGEAGAKNFFEKVGDAFNNDKKDDKKDGNSASGSNSHDSNMQYVKGLYKELLGRNIDPSGTKTWVGGLDNGKLNRAEVRKLIMQSDEYKKRQSRSKEKTENSGPQDSSISKLKDTLGGTSSKDHVENSVQKEFKFSPMAAGVIEFETAGITHQDVPACSCGWEYIFFSMFGENFGRVLLLHAGGKGRATRYFVQWGKNKEDGSVHRCERATDNLPDWHKWTVKWGGGKIMFYLDGKNIGEEKFEGRPNSCIIGGAKPSCRSFRGKWRNYVIKAN
jgi:hypothetical protein